MKKQAPAATRAIPTMRAVEIDGIRGWASLIVLFYHAFLEMLRVAVPAVGHPLLAPLFSANLAVSVFFVLSGDALSLSFFQSGRPGAIDRLVVRRYFRLTIPILMSCFVTYVLMKAGLDYHVRAAELLHRQDWLGNFLQFSPSFYEFLKYSLLKVYTTHTPEMAYNPFLWTMSIEMIGSMLVFLLCYLWPRLRSGERVCVFLAIALVMLGSNFALFFAGVLFSYLRRGGVLDRLLADRQHQFIALAAVAACVGIYIIDAGWTQSIVPLHRVLIPLLSMALVFCAYTHRGLKAFFSNRFARLLGVISFPLYLLQFQVLISLDSGLVVHDYAAKGRLDPGALLGFAVATIGVTIAAAGCFAVLERAALRAVDRRVLRLLA